MKSEKSFDKAAAFVLPIVVPSNRVASIIRGREITWQYVGMSEGYS
jgi:hypothetical protein